MKQTIIESLKKLIADRYLLVLLSVLILLAIIASITIGVSIHPTEFQPVSHYSAFGIRMFYTDQWFYLLVFVGFELIVALLNSAISVKLLVTRSRSLAIMYAWLSIGIILLGLIFALSVINVRGSI